MGQFSTDKKMQEIQGENHLKNASERESFADRPNIKHWHFVTVCLILYDVLAINGAYFLALWIRFDCKYQSIPKEYFDAYMRFIPIYTVVSLIVFWGLRLYRSIWRFASYTELLYCAVATMICFVIQLFGNRIF